MKKESFISELLLALSPFDQVIEWWGIAGSYANVSPEVEIGQGKDVDVVIWFSESDRLDEVFKELARISIQNEIIIHPIFMEEQNRKSFFENEKYKNMIERTQKIHFRKSPEPSNSISSG